MQLSQSATLRSSRKIVHCSLAQCCRLQMMLLQRPVEILLETFESVAFIVARFGVMSARFFRFLSQGRLHFLLVCNEMGS